MRQLRMVQLLEVTFLAMLLPGIATGQSEENSARRKDESGQILPAPLDRSDAAIPPANPEVVAPSDAPSSQGLDQQPRINPPPFDGPTPSMTGPAGLMGSPILGHMPVMADYRAFWIPTQPVSGQPTNLWMLRQDLSLIAPVWQDSENELSISARLRSEVQPSDAVFPISRIPLPEELWNIGVGGTYRHRFANDWIVGGSVLVGSASDKPFHGWDEMNIGLNTFLRVPQGDHNAWLFTLSYSPTAQISFPLPGVAFSWAPSDDFRANIGLPFQLMWRPTDDWTLDFSYMLLTSIHARATYHCWGPIRLYAGYDWENEAYLPVDRPQVKDRLFIYDMRLTAGAQAHLGSHWTFDLSSGYIFDRFYALGTGSALSNSDRIHVDPGPFLALDCRLRW
ncbi:MAG TPA: hypothetical protein VGX70_22585 [Gemmataceae bacterium]|nr:hypothetical protein [Gemmataceae bacterium]